MHFSFLGIFLKARAFIGDRISDAARIISWAMFLNITLTPMVSGSVQKTVIFNVIFGFY